MEEHIHYCGIGKAIEELCSLARDMDKKLDYIIESQRDYHLHGRNATLDDYLRQ